MQIPTVGAGGEPLAQAGAAVTARVAAGNLAAVPVGELLRATVASSGPGEAVVSVGGQSLTLRLPPGQPLPPGAVLLLRVPPGAAGATGPVVELSAPGPARPAGTAPPPAPAQPAQLSAVDVLSSLPGGRLRVLLDGAEAVATAPSGLVPGSRYVLSAEQTPDGIRLAPPEDSPALPAAVATALLRSPAPTLAASLAPLRAELASLTAPQQPAAVRDAGAAVEAALRALVPEGGRPPGAGQLRALVEDGGLHFEAKLARMAEGGAEPPAPGGDLKGDLLRLLQAVNDLGGAARAPAADAALRGIEARQAANVLAQEGGTPFVLQVPFPEGGEWRTLHLSLEPEYRPDQSEGERAGRFRVFMHVPLAELGETWIDAGLDGGRFRATIYLDRAGVRDRVRAALPELGDELRADGFSEVLLDVRGSADLPDGRRGEAAAARAGRPAGVSVLDVRV